MVWLCGPCRDPLRFMRSAHSGVRPSARRSSTVCWRQWVEGWRPGLCPAAAGQLSGRRKGKGEKRGRGKRARRRTAGGSRPSWRPACLLSLLRRALSHAHLLLRVPALRAVQLGHVPLPPHPQRLLAARAPHRLEPPAAAGGARVAQPMSSVALHPSSFPTLSCVGRPCRPSCYSRTPPATPARGAHQLSWS